MTNKFVAFTTRSKAATSGAGADNGISMYAQSDHRAFRTPGSGVSVVPQSAEMFRALDDNGAPTSAVGGAARRPWLVDQILRLS